MAKKAKFAFGNSNSIEAAKQAGKIDSFDFLLLDGDTDPKLGWLDANGNAVIVPNKTDLSGIEAELANKADTKTITALETEIATKVDATEVDEKLEAALGEYLAKKYEISHKPEGTLVNYRDKEIRVMCPADTQWKLQNSGDGADANTYYIGFKAYAPDNAVSFKEDTQKTIVDDTMYYFENNDFAGIDTHGRKYSIIWLPVAKYDGSTWAYYGANSNDSHYIGWYYSVEWYDTNGVLIASDCIKINLSNEKCHSSIEPYYVSDMMKEVDTKIDKKIEEKLVEVNTGYEIVEF